MPEVRQSEKWKADPLGEVLGPMFLQRSWELFAGKEGLRTRMDEPVTHGDVELSGDFLVSSYDGSSIVVITTPDWQWIGYREETDQPERWTGAAPTPFVGTIGGEKKKRLQPGKTRIDPRPK